MLARILRAPDGVFGNNLIIININIVLLIYYLIFRYDSNRRILNRFSKDVDTADTGILFSIRLLFIQSFRTIVSFIMISLETPIILAVVLPLAIVYYIFQRIYISTSRQLKRIDSTSRSPIYNHFSETVNGTSSIRAFWRL